MKKRIVSLLLALALLVLPVVSAGAAQPAAADPTPVQTQTDAAAESDQHCYSYIALGDSIVAGIACRTPVTSETDGITMFPATTRATPRIAMRPG